MPESTRHDIRSTLAARTHEAHRSFTRRGTDCTARAEVIAAAGRLGRLAPSRAGHDIVNRSYEPGVLDRLDEIHREPARSVALLFSEQRMPRHGNDGYSGRP